MAMSVAEFLNRPPREIADCPCAGCGDDTHPDTNGRHKTAQGFQCDDCYFGALGDMLEASPVGRASGHGGSFTD